jgi:WYL_2, Sm-like SH3 beta-barrel fold
MSSIYNKATVISLAAAHIRRTGCGWSQALKSAWGTHKEEVLVALLQENEAVRFTYLKGKGEVREAVGTLSSAVVARYGCTPATPGRKGSTMVVTYFDRQRNHWRCFNHGHLLKVHGAVDIAA